MDPFSGWSSPHVLPKHTSTAANDNPLLLLQQQQSMMSSASPAERARNSSLQFSNHSAIVNQSYTDQADQQDRTVAFDGDDKNAWAQNRCLLCLLYEEKLRVLQHKVNDLELNGPSKKTSRSGSEMRRDSQHQHHVTHSTVVSDQKQFLKLLGEKDHEIDELQKDLKHLAIDRDNVRSALDETQMKLEVALRTLDEMMGSDNNNNNNIGNSDYQHQRASSSSSRPNRLGSSRLGQPSLVSATAGSRSGSAANSRSGTPLPHQKYDLNEQVRPEVAEDVLGVSSSSYPPSARKSVTNENNNNINVNTTSLSSIMIGGASPSVSAIPSNREQSRQKYSDELSARRRQNYSNTPAAADTTQNNNNNNNINTNSKSSATKLTRDLADISLGMYPSEPQFEAPSSLSRLGPLPDPASLRSVTISAPSETWRKGGSKPGLIEMNARGTPGKSNSMSQQRLDLSSIMSRQPMNNNTNNGRSVSNISNQNQQSSSIHRQVSPTPQQSGGNPYREFTSHSPHYQSFGPLK